MEAAMAEALDLFTSQGRYFLSGVFSRPARGSALPWPPLLSPPLPPDAGGPLEKLALKPGAAGGYFAEFFTRDKAFHRSFSQGEILSLVETLCPSRFRTLTLRFRLPESILTATLVSNRRGRFTLLRSEEPAGPAEQAESGRAEGGARPIIPEGIAAPFLVRLGVMTPQGRVIAARRGKFRQINRFLEQVDYLVKALDARRGDAAGTFTIADLGSGKSYLSFAVHYLFTAVYKRPVSITGIDRKAALVRDCNTLAEHLSCPGLSFTPGDLEDLLGDGAGGVPPPDLLISLHACDTATDYALAYGILRGVHGIIAVPCCQHELNGLLDKKSCPPEFAPFLAHGLLKERFSALATDALRIEALEGAGYRVDALEFVDPEDTPKNLLIRAVKKNRPPQGSGGALREALGVKLSLEKLLESSVTPKND
ncbi:MAG: SAM-dependent methyltransferase [Spirochaetaceae bacterium]|jgi:hypothetical protein|nr:SAM-dependent methyltransferase [Spirochaetaceae bacterium]